MTEMIEFGSGNSEVGMQFEIIGKKTYAKHKYIYPPV